MEIDAAFKCITQMNQLTSNISKWSAMRGETSIHESPLAYYNLNERKI